MVYRTSRAPAAGSCLRTPHTGTLKYDNNTRGCQLKVHATNSAQAAQGGKQPSPTTTQIHNIPNFQQPAPIQPTQLAPAQRPPPGCSTASTSNHIIFPVVVALKKKDSGSYSICLEKKNIDVFGTRARFRLLSNYTSL